MTTTKLATTIDNYRMVVVSMAMIMMTTTPTTTVTTKETQQTTVPLISQLINDTISTQMQCRRLSKSVTSLSRDVVDPPTMASLSSACTAKTARRTSSDRVGFTWSYGLHRRRCLRGRVAVVGAVAGFGVAVYQKACSL